MASEPAGNASETAWSSEGTYELVKSIYGLHLLSKK